ncbi:MAG TPA: hypothetical protein VLA31_05340, partial [Burkholderiaceae bacterium]|nr:hypothetical protein [Burkholderiaceae bacterium]
MKAPQSNTTAQRQAIRTMQPQLQCEPISLPQGVIFLTRSFHILPYPPQQQLHHHPMKPVRLASHRKLCLKA